MNNELSLPYVLAQKTAANETVLDSYEPQDMAHMAKQVEYHMGKVLEALHISPDDPNVTNTPARYAKMMVYEVCRGRFEPPPRLTTFPNQLGLDEMITVGPIALHSLCAHHFCPILGKVWVGVVPGAALLGLSKFTRLVRWFAARPQLQEEMVAQIANHLETALQPKGLAVVIEGVHTCMSWRGVQEHNAVMTTNVMRGVFRETPAAREEFMAFTRR